MTHTSHLKRLLVAAALLLAASPAWANQVLAMANEADTIVIGEGVMGAFNTDASTVEFNVRADSVLKGEAALGSSLKAVYPLLSTTTGPFLPEKDSPPSDSYGLWFFEGDVVSHIRLPRSWVAPRGVSVERLLLTAVIESYRSSVSDEDLIRRGETSWAKMRMSNSLRYAHRFGWQDAALEVVEELMDSASVEELEIALVVGIGMSHDPALVRFGAELESLRLDANRTARIFSTIENSYTPTQGTAVLESLIRQNQKAQVVGLDSALAGALRRVHGRAMLPLAALLLDSPDERAVRRAAGYFHHYTLMAREDGSISTDRRSGDVHPYASAETKAHNGHDTSTSAYAHAEFWRGWWADNQQSLTP